MGYLLVLTFAFLFGLVVNAMFLGWLSVYLYGSVASWVLLISVLMGALAAWLFTNRYEEWEARSARGR